jgi:hypothetical protein
VHQEADAIRARSDGLVGAFPGESALVGAAVAAATATMPAACAQATTAWLGTVRDLTHVFRAGFPVTLVIRPGDARLPRLRTPAFTSGLVVRQAHGHPDAPGHIVPGRRWLVPELDPEEMFGPRSHGHVSSDLVGSQFGSQFAPVRRHT